VWRLVLRGLLLLLVVVVVWCLGLWATDRRALGSLLLCTTLRALCSLHEQQQKFDSFDRSPNTLNLPLRPSDFSCFE
jgi:hypothetical protein